MLNTCCLLWSQLIFILNYNITITFRLSVSYFAGTGPEQLPPRFGRDLHSASRRRYRFPIPWSRSIRKDLDSGDRACTKTSARCRFRRLGIPGKLTRTKRTLEMAELMGKGPMDAMVGFGHQPGGFGMHRYEINCAISSSVTVRPGIGNLRIKHAIKMQILGPWSRNSYGSWLFVIALSILQSPIYARKF